jgi:hypothetical protein
LLLFVALFVLLLVTYSLYHSLWFCGFLIKVIAIKKKKIWRQNQFYFWRIKQAINQLYTSRINFGCSRIETTNIHLK